MNWSLYLDILKESNLASLNHWHFGKVLKQRDYNQKNLMLSSGAGRNAPGDPRWAGLDARVSLVVGGQLRRPGDRQGFMLGSGKMSPPLPAVINTSPSHVCSVAPFTKTSQLKWKILFFLKLPTTGNHNFKKAKQQQKLFMCFPVKRDFEEQPFFKFSSPGFAQKLSD